MHSDVGVLHTAVQPARASRGSRVRLSDHSLCERHHLQLHRAHLCSMWNGPASIHAKSSIPDKFLLNFESYYPKCHLYISSCNMSICIVRIICSCCDIPEEGPEDYPEVWEVIQWIKQQQIPVAALVTSFAGQPSTCWCPSPLQSSWTKWCPLTVRISYPCWRKSPITPSQEVILWTSQ